MPGIVRITVIVENTAQGVGLVAEHGLAYWIEWPDGRRVLFDTGQKSVIVHNAFRLHLPLREAEAIVLSHGHFDHTGGLAEVLPVGRPATVYAHPAAFQPKFACNKDGTSREISMPAASQEAVRQPSVTVVQTVKATEIIEGLTVTGPVPRRTAFEDVGGPFFLDRSCREPDPLVDDQSLFFEAKDGLVVLLGCAHAGVINTLQYVTELANTGRIQAVIGGMHLVQASPERLRLTVEELRRLEVQRLAPAHCTGMAATLALWNAFPERCSPCHVGTRFEFTLP